MPVLVAPRTAPQPTIQDPRPTSIRWVAPNGRVTMLSDWSRYTDGIMVLPGSRGLLMPSYTRYEDASPGFDGTTVRGHRATARDITIPIHLWAPDRPACLAMFHQLVADLNPQNGTGTLVVSESDGTERSIGAYYSEGFEGQDDDDQIGRHWMTALLVFHAPQPYWEATPVNLTWSVGDDGTPFFPILPWKVKDSQVLGSVTIDNPGSVAAWPVWTVTGPGDSILIENTTTGESLFIDRAIVDGDEVVIDTRERQKTATLNVSTNLWPDMDIDSSMWALQPGSNQVNLEVVGATADSLVALTYSPRHLTAY